MAHVAHPELPPWLGQARANSELLRAAGQLHEAADLLNDALDATRDLVGPEHPEVLGLAPQVAELYWSAGDPAGARRVLEEALAAGQRTRPDDDRLLLRMSYDLGAIAEELGNRHEARRNFTRVVTLGAPVLGEDHPAVRGARAYLGEAGLVAAGPAPAGTNTRAEPTVPSVPAAVAQPESPRPEAAARAMASESVADMAGTRHQTPHLLATPTAPPRGVAGGSDRRPASATARAGLVMGSVAAVAALVAAGLAAVALLRGFERGTGSSSPTGGVALTGKPPTGVQVHRERGSIVVTWIDASAGSATYVVTGGKSGEDLRLLAQLPAGSPTRYVAAGFQPHVAYCFQVSAVYSVSQFGVAPAVCTTED